MERRPLSENKDRKSCNCEELQEKDIPGATLDALPEACKKHELQTWLACRGLSYKASSTKAVLVTMVRQHMSSGVTYTFRDPDPGQSHLRKKKANCLKCNTDVNAGTDVKVIRCKMPKEGWTDSTEHIPKSFTVLNMIAHMKKSGKNIKDCVTKENKENKTVVFAPTCLEKGYKFFYDSYLIDVECVKENNITFVRCKCYRSQKKNQDEHRLSVQLAPDGLVLDETCTCGAGKSFFCNHVLGLMYLLDHVLRKKLKVFPKRGTCTDNPQVWHKARTDGIKSEPLMCSTVVKPFYTKSVTKVKGIQSALYEARSSNTIETEQQFGAIARDQLALLNPLMGFCQVFSVSSDSCETYTNGNVPNGSTLSHQCALSEGHYNVTCNLSTVPTYPRMFEKNDATFVSFPQYPLKNGSLFPVNCPPNWNEKITLSFEEAIQMEILTRSQSASPVWHASRKDRITASRFGLILARKSKKEKLAEQFLTPTDISNVPAIKWGRTNEQQAVIEYQRYMERTGKLIKVEESGTVINPNFPWMSASPDRKVLDSDCGLGVLEVKCPQKYKDIDPAVAARNDEDFFIVFDNDQILLRRNHEYYAQVQGQMGITCTKWCDFVVYTTVGLVITRVSFDEEFWKSMVEKLKDFYENVFVNVALRKG